MRTRLAYTWESLHSSFWFLPFVLSALAAILATATLLLDRRGIPANTTGVQWVYGGEPEGAREMLSAIAASMLGVAGTVFSITIAVLSIATSALGSRLLRNFMRDRTNQAVLGIFVAIFLYCLLVMRTIRDDEGDVFVPHLSVAVGVVLAVVGLVALIYFIHHISQSIRAERAIADVARELERAIDRFFPPRTGKPAELDPEIDPAQVAGLFADSAPILADRDGYVQAIDSGALLSVAVRRDVVVHLLPHPGAFVMEGEALARVHPRERVDDALSRSINQIVVRGYERTPTQDIEFAISQMVQIALRALSPSVNDPHTAIACIDWLGAALGRAARREFPSAYRYDRRAKLRVVVQPVTYEKMVDRAFDQIRQAGLQHIEVGIRLLDVLANLLEYLDKPSRREAVLRQALAVHRGILQTRLSDVDRQDVEARMQRVSRAAHPDGS
ncbi:MAG TPA: DUF2254 domain-containing protein [Chloroflexi bacterium]|nr:DUF2254 domain-containing protein [Chloroflexota bacterium]